MVQRLGYNVASNVYHKDDNDSNNKISKTERSERDKYLTSRIKFLAIVDIYKDVVFYAAQGVPQHSMFEQ